MGKLLNISISYFLELVTEMFDLFTKGRESYFNRKILLY